MNEASLARAADAIAQLPRDRRTLVAVDGLDGAGKTTFADLLAPRLDRPVVRVRADDFLNPAAVRHARGRESPEDRAAYEALKRELATSEWPDMNHYAEAKGPLIRAIRARATG